MASDSVRKIQQALNDKGIDPGEIDGVWGRKTIFAVKIFQEKYNLKVDGVVGPKTIVALFTSDTVVSTVLPWLEEAKNLTGTKEILGTKSNPVIIDWSKDLDISYAGDDVPWCGLFLAHCIGSTLPQEVLPKNPLSARQWRHIGMAITPCIGAIMVFWRESKQGVKGHVGLYVGEDDSAYQILGGNQSDSVCLMWIDKNRLIEARWPQTAITLMSSKKQKTRGEGL
ncbi:TIGR02594 family protein [Aeromonas dhakensis]|uniref:NlpC/P60 family protein n=1 Tax=Aeromonas dhakensis TaxID=196024 RepID=UPI00227C09A4|nr:TIGR02594 family protein [Aeromonas dhakensis]WAG12396.1 TIGR02594 family protein [Aeromonas dhakensis]